MGFPPVESALFDLGRLPQLGDAGGGVEGGRSGGFGHHDRAGDTARRSGDVHHVGSVEEAEDLHAGKTNFVTGIPPGRGARWRGSGDRARANRGMTPPSASCRVDHVFSVVLTARRSPTSISGMQISFRRLHPEAPVPSQAHPGDAGWDLASAVRVHLQPGERAAVPTGIAVAIPPGYAGWVLPRSGHARRHGVGVVNAPGLIDSGYRGEIEVLLVNHGHEPVTFEPGDRIAQLVVVPVPDVTWVETDQLDDTARGAGGFGSSGR